MDRVKLIGGKQLIAAPQVGLAAAHTRHASRHHGTVHGTSSLWLCPQTLEALQASGTLGQWQWLLWVSVQLEHGGVGAHTQPVSRPRGPRCRSACTAQPGDARFVKGSVVY